MTRTFGIDISSFSKTIDWPKVRATLKPRFVLARAAFSGRNDLKLRVDERFAKEYWPALEQMKMPRGAYVYCRPKVDAEATIKTLFSAYQPKVGDIVPTLDIEDDYDTSSKVPVSTLVAQISTMVQHVSAKIGGQMPMIYTKARVWKELQNPKQFSDCPLWVIDYSSKEDPILPPTWPTFAIWQTGQSLKAEGIEGNYDPNLFNGAENKLESLFIKQVTL